MKSELGEDKVVAEKPSANQNADTIGFFPVDDLEISL